MKLHLLLLFAVCILSAQGPLWGQDLKDEPFKYAIRFTAAPQATYFSPYEDTFTPELKNRWSGFSFGAEASKWIAPNWDLGIGYYFSRQVGNSPIYDCLRIGPNPCPQIRGKLQLMKIPLSLGWYGIQKKEYSSKLSFGPQIQLLFSDPYIGFPSYRTLSLGLVASWAHYFVLTKHLDFVANLRFDHSITQMDEGKDKSGIKSLGLHLGLNYNL